MNELSDPSIKKKEFASIHSYSLLHACFLGRHDFCNLQHDLILALCGANASGQVLSILGGVGGWRPPV